MWLCWYFLLHQYIIKKPSNIQYQIFKLFKEPFYVTHVLFFDIKIKKNLKTQELAGFKFKMF